MDDRNTSARAFLFSPGGRQFLEREYSTRARSTHEIADERKTYHKLVLQALQHHKIHVRTRSEAQTKALASGRATHPTKDTTRPTDTCERISQTLITQRNNAPCPTPKT